MTDRASPEVLAALRETLENQIAANDPPETAATLERLRSAGMDEDQIWRLMSAVVLQEMGLMLASTRPFDRAGYIAALERLPELVDR